MAKKKGDPTFEELTKREYAAIHILAGMAEGARGSTSTGPLTDAMVTEAIVGADMLFAQLGVEND